MTLGVSQACLCYRDQRHDNAGVLIRSDRGCMGSPLPLTSGGEYSFSHLEQNSRTPDTPSYRLLRHLGIPCPSISHLNLRQIS